MGKSYHRAAPEILLCDDSPIERGSVARLLREAGYQVHEAGDGDAALALIRDLAIDLVVLDLNMPQVDGFGVLTYLQKHRRAMPVVLLSGMPPDRIQHKIHKLPNPELPPLLIKPINPDHLLGVIELQLSGQLSELESGLDGDEQA